MALLPYSQKAALFCYFGGAVITAAAFRENGLFCSMNCLTAASFCAIELLYDGTAMVSGAAQLLLLPITVMLLAFFSSFQPPFFVKQFFDHLQPIQLGMADSLG